MQRTKDCIWSLVLKHHQRQRHPREVFGELVAKPATTWPVFILRGGLTRLNHPYSQNSEMNCSTIRRVQSLIIKVIRSLLVAFILGVAISPTLTASWEDKITK
jgi:hypothetical protein